MKFNVYSVFDEAAGTFAPPFILQSDGLAVRTFSAEVNNPKSGVLYQSPGDFSLHRLGTFDDETGVFYGESPVHRLLTGSSCRVDD